MMIKVLLVKTLSIRMRGGNTPCALFLCRVGAHGREPLAFYPAGSGCPSPASGYEYIGSAQCLNRRCPHPT
jgi:hypothetical protein